ncbi:hypothetical protein [Nostoc sp.]
MPVLKSLEPRKLRLQVFAVAGCANESLSVKTDTQTTLDKALAP